MSGGYLADKSALARLKLEPVRERLAPLLEAGLLLTCSIIDLEVLYSARNAEDHDRILQRRRLAYRRIPLTEEIFGRTMEIQGLLARRNHHRLPIPDLILAAAAESADATILHYDQDFDRIAAVTGQPVEWVVPPGSL